MVEHGFVTHMALAGQLLLIAEVQQGNLPPPDATGKLGDEKLLKAAI